jgi:hypothetical protein
MDFQAEMRLFGIFGVGLTLFGIFAPFEWHEMPSWIAHTGLAVGVLLTLWSGWRLLWPRFAGHAPESIRRLNDLLSGEWWPRLRGALDGTVKNSKSASPAGEPPPAPPVSVTKPVLPAAASTTGALPAVDKSLTPLFAIGPEKKFLWLKFLPDDPSSKEQYTFLALLFGYKELLGINNVNRRVLDDALRASRLTRKGKASPLLLAYHSMITAEYVSSDQIYFEDYFLSTNYVTKAGLSRRGEFTLTEKGYNMARYIVYELIKRA